MNYNSVSATVFCLAVLTAVLTAVLPARLHAQCSNCGESLTTLEDFDQITLKTAPNVTTPPGAASRAYSFAIPYDSSMCRYTIADIRHNRLPLKLRHWKLNCEHRNWDETQISDSSGTAEPYLSQNDTLSFYREFFWNRRYGSGNAVQRLSNYFARDTLDIAVELVNAATGSRLALLDSFGVLRRVPEGYPTIYGARPIVALVTYIVPPPLSGHTAYIRVTPTARGDDEHYFMRLDRIELYASQRPTDPDYLKYIGEFGGGIARRAVEELRRPSSTGEEPAALIVTPNPSNGLVTIRYSAPSEGKSVGIAIYNAQGDLEFMQTGAEASPMTYRFTTGGNDVVALFHNGALVTTETIHIAK